MNDDFDKSQQFLGENGMFHLFQLNVNELHHSVNVCERL